MEPSLGKFLKHDLHDCQARHGFLQPGRLRLKVLHFPDLAYAQPIVALSPLKQVLSVALAAARVSHRLALAGYHIRPTQLVDNPFGRNRGFAMIQDSVFRHLGNINRDWTGHPGSVQFTGRLTRSLRIL